MAESVACPNCQARLELPALLFAAQPVQCPRCASIFEPAPPRPPPIRLPRGIDVADDVAPPVEPIRSWWPKPRIGRWKAPVAMIALAACLLSYLFQLYVNFEHFELLRRELAGRPIIRFGMVMDPWSRWEQLADDARTIHQLTFWPAAVLFLIWLHQASSNAWNLRAKDLQFSPIAALSFLVPLLNLVWPYFMIQEIWRASHPRATDDPLAWKNGPSAVSIRLWWAGFLATGAFLVFNHVMSANPFNADEQCAGALFACGANVFMIATVALTIHIIRDIRARQDERHARLCDASPGTVE